MTLPSPYYQDDAVTLYHGDCREILPHVEADALVSDPPFGIAFGGATWKDRPEEYPEFIKWLAGAAMDCVPDGWVFLFQSATNFCRFHEWFPDGWRVFAACKNFVQMRPTEVQYGWDPVVFWRNGDVIKRHRHDAGTVTRDWHVGNVAGVFGAASGHPSPRPVDTMRHIVLVGSRGGQTVLDPFAGSGTTLRAAKDLGRKAIGIEIEERYCEIAARRLGQEVLPLGEGLIV